MKKAVLYARVSSSIQKKEKTIESQIVALKKSIVEAGDILVKEYIDDGYSGARLDRPALNQLRQDLRLKMFDTIYFLNTDRIARDVTYQNIIISEILKHKKRIIINGKDYVHNPENKFTLTVLGAVAELERAKIIERANRGKQLKLARGYLLGFGCGNYGYDYIHKTPTTLPKMVINQKEARVVRFIFKEYAKGKEGMNQICKKLEDKGIKTKNGKRLWRRSYIKIILNNHTYCGIKYYNTIKRIREYANPLHNVSYSSSKLVKRDKREWIGIKVPAIVSKSLFDKVQERLIWNKKHYRNPKRPSLLSSLIKCGYCNSGFYCYRRYVVRKPKTKPHYVYHKTAYKCNWRLKQNTHSKKARLKKCISSEIKSSILEDKVFKIIKEVILEPEELKKHIDFFKEKGKAAQKRMENKLKALNDKIQDLIDEKKRILDIYASGDLDRKEYVKRSLKYDNDINGLKIERMGLVKKVPLLNNPKVLINSLEEYCNTAKIRYRKCNDFNSKRQFLVDYVKQVTYWNAKIAVHGSIPVLVKETFDEDQTPESETGQIEFKVER